LFTGDTKGGIVVTKNKTKGMNMSLSVRTVHGKKFRRAGREFGPEPVVVSDKELAEIVVPATKKAKAKTRGELLLGEPMLVCVEAKAEK
jgi:hypothetical protein